jgi:translation initiation factor 5A
MPGLWSVDQIHRPPGYLYIFNDIFLSKLEVNLMEKRQIEIKKLRPGGFVLIDDVPCVVEKVQTSKAGKHGAAKARLFAKGLFTDVKKIIVKPGDSSMDIPIIEKLGAQVIALSGDNVQVMDSTSYETFDIHVPDEMKGELVEGDEVIIWRFGSYMMIKSKKT